MTRTEFLNLLELYSIKCATSAVVVASGKHTTLNVTDDLIRMWQEISAAVVEHWDEKPPLPPRPKPVIPGAPPWARCPTCGPSWLEPSPNPARYGPWRCHNCKEYLVPES
jgi:hypothetical protein